MTDVGHDDPIVSVRVQAGTLAARQAWDQLAEGLRPFKLDEDDFARIRLVIVEVLNNVIEHAYDNGSHAGPISLDCRKSDTCLHLQVRDTGKVMPGGILPEGKAHDLDVDLMDLPEGGFGWFLIRDLAQEIVYARKGSENHLSLRFDLSEQTN